MFGGSSPEIRKEDLIYLKERYNLKYTNPLEENYGRIGTNTVIWWQKLKQMDDGRSLKR